MTIEELNELLNLEIDKASALYGEISDNEKVKEMIVGLVTIRRRVNLEGISPAPVAAQPVNDPGGIIGWLMANQPKLYLALWAMDKAADGALFHDPNHTISWHVATMAKNGEPFGIACCAALNLLSPNHCEWALNS